MLSYKTKSLLAFLLAVIVAVSLPAFGVLAESEDSDVIQESDILSEESDDNSAVESEDNEDDSQAESVSESEDTSVTESADDDSEENNGAAGTESDNDSSATTSGGLVGIAVIGGILLLLAIIIIISILRKKPFGMKVMKFYKDFKSELKKVVWLSRKETIKQTGVVLTTLIIAIIFLGLLDYLFTQLITLI